MLDISIDSQLLLQTPAYHSFRIHYPPRSAFSGDRGSGRRGRKFLFCHWKFSLDPTYKLEGQVRVKFVIPKLFIRLEKPISIHFLVCLSKIIHILLTNQVLKLKLIKQKLSTVKSVYALLLGDKFH